MRLAVISVIAVILAMSFQGTVGPIETLSFHDGDDKLVNNRSADTYPSITQSETSMAASPTTDNLVIGWNDSGHAGDCSGLGYGRSTDGGAIWSDLGFLPPGTSPISGITAAGVVADPVLGSNASGDFFFAALANEPGGACGATGRSFIGLWRSQAPDDGQNFQFLADASPGTDLGNFQDKEEMAIDQNSGNIYVCWTEIEAGLGFVVIRILVSRSTDGGENFSSPQTLRQVTLNFVTQVVVGGCAVAVAPDGKVYVAWAEGETAPGDLGEIKLRRSDDGGATWTPDPAQPAFEVDTGAIAGDDSTNCFVNVPGFGLFPRPALKGEIRDAPIPTIAVSPDGQVNLAVTQGVGVASPFLGDIMYTRSNNLGITGSWDPLITINSDSTNDQFQPRLAVDPNDGTIGIIWYDRRHDPSNLSIHVREGISYDNGDTWTDLQVTDAEFGVPPINPNFDPGIGDCYMGDYNAIIAHDSRFLMAWGDNRLLSGPPSDHPDPDIRFDAHSITDLDGDGVDNDVDTDDDGDGHWDDDETAKGSDLFADTSTPEHCDGVDNDGDTTVDEAPAGSGRTTPDPLCDPAADPDGDTIPNSADLDDDDDGWSDVDEQFLSTDELDDCPDNSGHDALAPDFDKNTKTNIIDVLHYGAVIFGDYNKRFDLNTNGSVNIIDVLMFGAVIGQDCDGP